MPQALELDLGDLKLAALAWGKPSGRPVLACHGWLDNAATMTELAPRLCQKLDLYIVSLDLPGHGFSEHKSGHYHFVDWVGDVLAAADALGWERFSLMGHSMGAGISTLVAGAAPERIERCVLLEGIGPMADAPGEAARRLARSLRLERRKRTRPKRLFPDPETATARLLEATRMEPSSARTLIDRGLVEVAIEGVIDGAIDGERGWAWRADPKLRLDSRMRYSEEAVHAFLAQISCPVMIILAEEGWPHAHDVVRKRVEAVAGIEVVELPGRHHVHLDDGAAVAAVLEPFFAGLCAS